MNGNITTISLESGHIIDTGPTSHYCQICALINMNMLLCAHYKFKATDPLQYETFLARHENSCLANNKGSAEAMEIVGTEQIFRCTMEKRASRYGMAIRQNNGDSNTMKSATAASLFHIASSATNDYHIHCPSGSDSCCLFTADKLNNTSTYKPGPGLLLDIIKVIKSIYQEMCSESLLKNCNHSVKPEPKRDI